MKTLEKDIKKFIINNMQDFIYYYLDEIFFKGNFNEEDMPKIEYYGSEVMTGKGRERMDMLFFIKWIRPIAIVIELKQEVDTNSFIQLSKYMRDIKKNPSRIIETKNLLHNIEVYGVLVGKYCRPSTKELIKNDLSQKISYVDFYNSEFYCLPKEKTFWYTNKIFDNKKELWVKGVS